jgi:nicotinamidase-related amidase
MRDCLLLVDVFNDFRHDDGRRLAASFRERAPALRRLLHGFRLRGEPVIFANDAGGVFDGNARAIVERALQGAAGPCMADVAPEPGESFVVKPRYSAFDSTPLAVILADLEVERIVLAGMSTEGCVAQTAIAAREAGYKTTVVPEACATVDPELEGIALAYLERVVGVRLSASPPADTSGPPGEPSSGGTPRSGPRSAYAARAEASSAKSRDRWSRPSRKT